MNDRTALRALLESPGFLLSELGITTAYLYRPKLPEWRFVPTTFLDEEIWENGEALVFRLQSDGCSTILRFSGQLPCPVVFLEADLSLVTVRPDYVGAGKKFFVSLRNEKTDEHRYWPASALRLLRMLPPTEKDTVFPW